MWYLPIKVSEELATCGTAERFAHVDAGDGDSTSRNCSNIHCSSLPGRPGRVGAYHTHCLGFLDRSAFAGMMNAVRPLTRKSSPGQR